jgi:hypothetical protein
VQATPPPGAPRAGPVAPWPGAPPGGHRASRGGAATTGSKHRQDGHRRQGAHRASHGGAPLPGATEPDGLAASPSGAIQRAGGEEIRPSGRREDLACTGSSATGSGYATTNWLDEDENEVSGDLCLRIYSTVVS